MYMRRVSIRHGFIVLVEHTVVNDTLPFLIGLGIRNETFQFFILILVIIFSWKKKAVHKTFKHTAI